MQSIDQNLNEMSVHDLCDLLAVKTTELLSLFEQKGTNGIRIRDLNLEVVKIQEAINRKKMAKQEHSY